MSSRAERFHVRRLHRRARDDRLLAGADHHPRRRGDVLLDDPVEIGLRGHAEHRFDRFGVDVVALVEAVVEADQHVACARGGVGLALDLHPVAARRDMDAEPLLDRDQMAVVIAEQRPEQIGLLELDLEPGAAGSLATAARSRRAIRRPPAGARAPSCCSGRRRRAHSIISPGSASVSTWTDCSQGERPIIWPACGPCVRSGFACRGRLSRG